MKIYDIEQFKIDNNAYIYLIDKIYEFSKELNVNFPNYKNWFYNQHIEGIGNGRTTLFSTNDKGQINGICHLKAKDNEKRICYLYVGKEEKEDIDFRLLEKAFSYLNTTKPVVVLNLDNYIKYRGLIDEYNWKLKGVSFNCDFSYNGKTKNKIK